MRAINSIDGRLSFFLGAEVFMARSGTVGGGNAKTFALRAN